MIALDVISVFPLIGAGKYLDDIGTLGKNTVKRVGKNLDTFGDVFKHSDNFIDGVGAGFRAVWKNQDEAVRGIKETIEASQKRLDELKRLEKEIEGGTSALAKYGDDFGKMGTYVENPNIKVDWTQYAEHAAERMQQRGMTQEIVNDIVENGKVLSQNNGSKFAYITTDGVAIVSKEGKLITAWSSADFDSSMLDIIDKLFGK